MPDTIQVTRQEILNLYRVAKAQTAQLEKLLVSFDLTNDEKESRDVIKIYHISS